MIFFLNLRRIMSKITYTSYVLSSLAWIIWRAYISESNISRIAGIFNQMFRPAT